jgi:hypothetical protein
MPLKVANLMFAALFLLAAVVQFNDPDPGRWVALYLTASACSVAFHLGRLPFGVALLVASGALIWSLTLLPTVIRFPPALAQVFGDVKMYGPGVEEAREMGGLWLVAGWLGTISLIARRRSRH